MNMYGVWHVPTAATISPIDLLLLKGRLCRRPRCRTARLVSGSRVAYRFIALSILSSSAIVGTTLAALDSGSRPSRMAPTNSTS